VMIVRRTKSCAVFTLRAVERRLLERAVGSLLSNYQAPPQEVDDKVAGVWYSSRGCESAGMSPEQTAQWLKQIHTLRLGRVEGLKKCLRQLRTRKPGPFTLRVGVANAEALMVALNDYRLWIAARTDIGELEMVLHSFSHVRDLPPPQKAALREIEFLAFMVDGLLQLLQGSASPRKRRGPDKLSS
jgi:hypothetical protein